MCFYVYVGRKVGGEIYNVRKVPPLQKVWESPLEEGPVWLSSSVFAWTLFFTENHL